MRDLPVQSRHTWGIKKTAKVNIDTLKQLSYIPGLGKHTWGIRETGHGRKT